MICVKYNTEGPTGLRTCLNMLSTLIKVSITIFDPQFRLILTTGEQNTEEQSQSWQQRHEITMRYPDMRLLPNKTAEVIDEVFDGLNGTTTIGYIVMSRFYFDANANPHIKKFRYGKPVYDEIIIKDSLRLISLSVQSCLQEFAVVDPALPQQLDDYICSHLNDKITLVTARRALNVDTYSIQMYLLYQYNCNLISYVKIKKFEEAKKLLAKTELPLADIAANVGLTELQLLRLFKNQTSMTPEEYREKAKKSRV